MALIDVPERMTRWRATILLLIFASVGVVAAVSQDGPSTPMRRIIMGVVVVTTLPVGVFILRARLGLVWRQQPSAHGLTVTAVFVAYADLGVGAALFTFVDHEAAMYGTSLFAVIAIFAGYFTTRPVVLWHVVYTSVVVTVLAWLTWRQGQHDAAGVVARWLASLIGNNYVLVSLEVFNRGVEHALDAQLDNATRDPLTGLLNRRGLDQWADQFLRSRSRSVGFIMIDLDEFKSINDAYGHQAGDAALVLVGERLQEMVGGDAAIARIGGEEFVLLLAATCDETLEIAHALRIKLNDRDDAFPVSVSVGVSFVASDDSVRTDPLATLGEGLRRADAALFDAKHAGRNRVHAYQTTRDQDSPPSRH